MELYESLFIIRPTLSDEETTALIEKMKGTVTKNGASLARAENWGRKKRDQARAQGHLCLLLLQGARSGHR